MGTDLRLELTRISEAQDHILRDQVNLLKRVDKVLNSENVSNPKALELATSLLEFENDLVIHTNSDKSELAKLCFCDQVNLLNTVAVALNSGIISNPEECQLATSLVDRFRAAVANPISDDNHSGFLRVYECKSIKKENLLGKGSFGDVHEVKWLGIPAAEKTLPEESAQVDFDQEVSILARLSHPSIVRLLCYMKERVKCSIILELMDKVLTALIKGRMKQDGSRRGFPFSATAEVVDILLQIAEGMDYLHRRRVLHRDLKSANILVKCVKLVRVEFVHAKVADFGISKTKERSITIHHPTWNRGTTRWMAPELIRANQYQTAGNSDNNVDNGFAMYPFLSDVFSFGMVCYEILTGNIPFAVVSQPNKVKKMITEGERPPLPPHCPPGLASMTKKCWRAEPKERPSFAEICRELRLMKGSLLMGKTLSSINHSSALPSHYFTRCTGTNREWKVQS